jgi:hypothetical protein
MSYVLSARVLFKTSRFFSNSAAGWRWIGLTLAVALVCVAHYGWWTPQRWTVPADYGGESLEMLARIQAAAEGDLAPLRPQVMSRLGAPFGANWSAYPSSDLLLLWSLGQLARVTGVAVAANLALLLAVLTAAWSFYGCARWLRVRGEWAMAGALLFAFTFQAFNRGLPHLLVAFSWTVPLAIFTCALVAASRRVGARSLLGGLVLGTALVIGVSNPYHLFLYLQLMTFALLAQWFGRRRWDNLRLGLCALAMAGAAFLVVEMHVWLYTTDTAADSPLERNYGGTERYALKPLELVVPPSTHRWEAWAFFGNRYLRWSDWRSTEAFAPYLGVAGVMGLLWLSAEAWVALSRRRRVPGGALMSGWVLAFASVGGLTNVFAFFTGLALFRASNRFSIFLSAIVLLFLVSRLSRWWRGRSVIWSAAAALVLVLVGLADQLPRPSSAERQERTVRMAMSDREFGQRLEAALPAGAMVFQMPVVVFPEAPPQFQLGDSEHFRPFLATNALRFSYGAIKGRSRGQWQRDLARMPTAELVKALESYGFAAIYLNRRGFADRGERLLAELAALGRTGRIEGVRREQIVVPLQPSATPVPPLAHTVTFGRGWHRTSLGSHVGGALPEPRWAYESATMSYYNPHRDRRWYAFKFKLSGAGARRTLRLAVNGAEQLDVKLDGTAQDYQFRVQLNPGPNHLDLKSPEPAVRLSEERRQLRMFAVHESAVTMAAGPEHPES